MTVCGYCLIARIVLVIYIKLIEFRWLVCLAATTDSSPSPVSCYGRAVSGPDGTVSPAGRSGRHVGGQTATVLILVLLIAVLIFVAIYVPRFLMRRAVRSVIALFRRQGATSPDKATTLEELGLVRGSPFDRMFKVRDYRPYAARLLGQANILRATDEGTVYLSEADLENSPVSKFARVE